MKNIIDSKWADAIAERLSDEWCGKEDCPEDAKILQSTLKNLFLKSPQSCLQLIGTGIIEEDYFEPLD